MSVFLFWKTFFVFKELCLLRLLKFLGNKKKQTECVWECRAYLSHLCFSSRTAKGWNVCPPLSNQLQNFCAFHSISIYIYRRYGRGKRQFSYNDQNINGYATDDKHHTMKSLATKQRQYIFCLAWITHMPWCASLSQCVPLYHL